MTDPGYFPRGLLGYFYSRLARFSIARDETLAGQLRALGYDIDEVRTVVISHLHQDHIGGLRELGHAEIIVGSQELEAAESKGAAFRGYLRDHIFIPGLRWRPVAGRTDLFEDGSAIVLPTPGHTPGSLSLLVRRDGAAPLLFVGDLTYDVSLLGRGRVPGVGDRQGLEESSRLVGELADAYPGLVVLAAHDPAARGLLDEANASLT